MPRLETREELNECSELYEPMKKVDLYEIKYDLDGYVEYRNKKKSLEEEWMQAIKNRDTSIISRDFNKEVTKTEELMNAFAVKMIEYLAQVLGY